MKIPDNITIGGNTYKVTTKEEWGKTYWGKIFHDKQEIILDSSPALSVIESTFIHELIHAIHHERGLGPFFANEDTEENYVNAFSSGLYSLLKQNPNIFIEEKK